MLESLINPKRLEKGSWKMFFIGLLYGSLSLLLVKLFFSKDEVLSKFSGLIVVTFCVMFSLPFIYHIMKKEEKEDEDIEGLLHVWRVHREAIFAFIWLFIGFVIAFAFWNSVLQDSNLLNAQIQTYCMINSPSNVDNCVNQYSFDSTMNSGATAAVSSKMMRFLSILENNIYVMIFTLVFSLIFGAGAIFILAWNASVIAGAIGIFTKYSISALPLGFFRYMIHGVPEIAAYFITALAGGILGIGFIRNDFRTKRFVRVLENVMILLFVALVILILAGLMEVYFTPMFFN